jgi:hypothetical protein
MRPRAIFMRFIGQLQALAYGFFSPKSFQLVLL